MSIFTDSEAARFAAFREGAAILRDGETGCWWVMALICGEVSRLFAGVDKQGEVGAKLMAHFYACAGASSNRAEATK